MTAYEELYLFHVHTKRCGHAEEIEDEAYVEKAIEMGATRIVFTDHAPFPDNPFGNRMKYEQLEEYITSLICLKEKYRQDIIIDVGLEIEYLPSFRKYYEELRGIEGLGLLLLGQHIYEYAPGRYNFSITDKRKKQKEEYTGITTAIIEGIQSSYFDVVAHPDRVFRFCGEWTEEYAAISQKMIDAAVKNHMPLELNCGGIDDGYYREQFWDMVPEDYIVYGVDAHRTLELERIHLAEERSCRRSI